MAATRLPMRRLRELLRLKYDAGLSHRAIAQACAMGLGTVTTYLQRAAAAKARSQWRKTWKACSAKRVTSWF